MQEEGPFRIDKTCDRQPCHQGHDVGYDAESFEKSRDPMDRDPEEGNHGPDDECCEGEEISHIALHCKGSEARSTASFLQSYASLHKNVLKFSHNKTQVPDSKQNILNIQIDSKFNSATTRSQKPYFY